MRIFATPDEAATILNRTPQTIRNWIADGILETAPRVGRKHSIYVRSIAELAGLDVEEVKRLLDEMETKAAQEARERRKQRIINKPGALASVVV
jgi:DNA-binding transcriptional MerR regulator